MNPEIEVFWGVRVPSSSRPVFANGSLVTVLQIRRSSLSYRVAREDVVGQRLLEGTSTLFQ